ncbi:MAG: type I secretion C-terminal target domain-containing protein, partial [Gammaproteobacteria bacterium]
LARTLVLKASPLSYVVTSVELDGVSAEVSDPLQGGEISTRFAERGKEQRIDFKLKLLPQDEDADGMPDWWERQYGLNPSSAQDAWTDGDGDGWANLAEFRLATNPTVANTQPLLQDSLLLVSAGGTAGVYLALADADTAAASLRLTVLEPGAGLSWSNAGSDLAVGDSFSYADVLAGRLAVSVEMSFVEDTARFLVEDLSSAEVPPQEVALVVEAFAPDRRWSQRPAVWLDAERLPADWPDAGPAGRDGYQPTVSSQPASDGAGRVLFGGSQFLYLDDRELSLDGDFTAFAVFGAGETSAAEQALISASDLVVQLVSDNNEATLEVVQNGRVIEGPAGEALAYGRTPGLTVMSASGAATLDFRLAGGAARFAGETSADVLPSSFATIGAARALSAGTAGQFFTGNVRELLFYEGALSAAERQAVQDYQASRWDGVRVWNYRLATVPLVMHGDDGVSNVMNGGEGDDALTGGSQSDTLRGGPGSNTLTGGRSGDRFSFEARQTADVVTDFSEWENDVIDLAEVLAGKAGPLTDYLSIKAIVTPMVGQEPRVDSILQLNHAGLGTASGVDQTITLEGVAVGNSDLPRLLAQGSIVTGRAEESAVSVDPLVVDSDGDGVLDAEDALPYDATETVDTDGDRIGNNADPDDDNDGFADELDRFPLDASEWFDTDNDGIGNNADLDDDNDGWSDTREIAAGTNPLDPNSYPVLPERRGLPPGVLELLLGD